jgi:hypothetical protein
MNCNYVTTPLNCFGWKKRQGHIKYKKLKACETSRLPHFVDNRLTDGGEVVSLTRWPPFTPRKIPVLISVRG